MDPQPQFAQCPITELESCAVWEDLASRPRAVLLDVRTKAEHHSVGVPSLPEEHKLLFACWGVNVCEEHTRNPRNHHHAQAENWAENWAEDFFLKTLCKQGLTKGVPVYVLCRSGNRSRQAARFLASRNYGPPCINIADGFEGVLTFSGVRVHGWKNNGLPWEYPQT